MASSSGEKYIRFTTTEAVTTYITGIHSFDTDGTGDPSTVNGTDSLAEGHDLIDIVVPDSELIPDWLPGAGVFKILRRNTVEFTVQWQPTGESDKKWTSYGYAHNLVTADQDATSANFVPTTLPTLWIDGVSQGEMYNTTSTPLGQLHESDQIFMFVTGFGNYDDTEAQDALDIMNIQVGNTVGRTGIGIFNAIEWTGDGTVTSGPYIPSLPLPVGQAGHIIFPPNQTPVPYDDTETTNYNIKGYTESVVYPDGFGIAITASHTGPIDSIFEASTYNKLYHKIDTSVLPAAADGVNWVFSGNISVTKVEPSDGSPWAFMGDLDGNYVVDNTDFAIMAANWLAEFPEVAAP